MSTDNKKEVKKVKYPVIEMDKKGKLILPDHIITQINILHGKVGAKEWSGLLLYDVISGSPAKPEGFVLKAKHIFLMDIGTGAYTEYETDGDIVDLYDNVEGAMEAKMGHIHTHHSMGAYFSGTDTEELDDNVDKHNYYLSLIVSFNGVYAAKVAFLSDVHTSSKLSYVDDGGKPKHFKTDKVQKSMVTVDMSVYYEKPDKFFYDRYSQVVKKIAEKEKLKPKVLYGAKTYYPDAFQQSLLKGTSISKIDSDPKKMTDFEVEKLARNLFSVTPELDEAKGAYHILHTLSNSKKEEIEFYYDYFSKHIEVIIENFFDQSIEVDEMIEVIAEVSASMVRFSNNPHLKDIIEGIDEVLEEFLAHYQAREEEDDDEDNTIESKLTKEANALT